MVEWTLVGMICATAIMMIAHTIDEAVSGGRPPRTRSHCCPVGPVRKGELASRVDGGNDDEVQKWAA